ncbi:anthranilate phosphoribosyltransferase [Kitasatospora sp. NPDC096147]|uniref:anthranilate phosphoribosyltransferase n=1 Tax=Kitasatospora sp. NPDC096147 TaxID=3364093 RepID=UPI00380C525F
MADPTRTTDLKSVLGRLADGEHLTREESARTVGLLTSGEATASQMGALLMALRMRGETVEEIVGAASHLRTRMLRVAAPPDAMDVVGTGGDSSGSYNISTCAALVVAGAGVPVAKHGNRALSSRSGSADVLRALGVQVDLTPSQVGRCVAESGIGFMFAPAHHPALRHVAATRVELGTRTVFNLLGPLLNPAGVRRHLIGVFARHWLEPLAEVLHELGSERAYVVHGSDGLDEITLTGPTSVAALEHGRVRSFEIDPERLGLTRVTPAQLRGGDAEENATALRAVLRGEPGPYREVALLNSAAALVVAGRAEDLADGLLLAAKSVDSGEALARLESLVSVSHLTDPSERTP